MLHHLAMVLLTSTIIVGKVTLMLRPKLGRVEVTKMLIVIAQHTAGHQSVGLLVMAEMIVGTETDTTTTSVTVSLRHLRYVALLEPVLHSITITPRLSAVVWVRHRHHTGTMMIVMSVGMMRMWAVIAPAADMQQ